MDHLSNNLLFNDLVVLLIFPQPLLVSCADLNDVVFNPIESPERQNYKMASLWISAANSKH